MSSESSEKVRAGNSGEVPASVRPQDGRTVEPWLAACLAALVPLVGALFVPRAWSTLLHVGGGVLCALGMVLLVLQERSARRSGARVTEGR